MILQLQKCTVMLTGPLSCILITPKALCPPLLTNQCSPITCTPTIGQSDLTV